MLLSIFILIYLGIFFSALVLKGRTDKFSTVPFVKTINRGWGVRGGGGEKMVDHCMNDVVSHTSIRMPEVGLFKIPHNTWISFSRGK